jgi:ureidoacrylate peracid hydrolase
MTNTPTPAVVPNPYVDRASAAGPWSFDQVDPRHTALLLVDLQNDYCHPQGAWAKVARDENLPTVISTIRALLPAIRQAGVPVLHVRSVYNDWTVSPLVADTWHRLGIGPVCWEGSWGVDFYEIMPVREDRIVSKFRGSGFLESDLELTLRAKKINTVLLGGMMGWGGLFETAYDALAREHPAVLLEDCIAGGTAAERQTLVEMFSRFWGHAVSAATVRQAWQ